MMYHNELEELQHHWGGAYVITHPVPDLWIAYRRDDGASLRAETAGELWDLIRADYDARPVPRGSGPEA